MNEVRTDTAQSRPLASKEHRLMEVARELEASFLAEMLKSAGLGQTRGEFGGGIGEEQFGSLLVMQQARWMAAKGGIGLAQSLFEGLVHRQQGVLR